MTFDLAFIICQQTLQKLQFDFLKDLVKERKKDVLYKTIYTPL